MPRRDHPVPRIADLRPTAVCLPRPGDRPRQMCPPQTLVTDATIRYCIVTCQFTHTPEASASGVIMGVAEDQNDDVAAVERN